MKILVRFWGGKINNRLAQLGPTSEVVLYVVRGCGTVWSKATETRGLSIYRWSIEELKAMTSSLVGRLMRWYWGQMIQLSGLCCKDNKSPLVTRWDETWRDRGVNLLLLVLPPGYPSAPHCPQRRSPCCRSINFLLKHVIGHFRTSESLRLK